MVSFCDSGDWKWQFPDSQNKFICKNDSECLVHGQLLSCSFGKQDLIQNAVHFIKEAEKITIDEEKEVVFQKIISSNNQLAKKHLWHFNKNVPHWFLSPWFQKTGEREVYRKSKSFSNDCLYALDKDEIEINPRWKYYLIANSGILKDFCYWNLALFL